VSAPSTPSLLFTHWQLDPALDVAAAVIVALYAWGTLRVRGRWPAHRTVAYVAGVGCLLMALQSGVASFDDRLLSAHMVQHMLLLMLAPPLLIAGRPVILALRAFPPSRRPAVARMLAVARPYTRPAVCLAIFYGAVLLTHIPGFYDATLRHPELHEAEHVLYLLSGLLLFWPILDGDPAPAQRLGGLGRLLYMLVAMLPMAVVGAYLNRHASLVYAPYGPQAKALGISALSDQAQAGAIMWVIGNTIMVAIGLCAVIAALVADERRQQARDARAALGAPEGSGQL
jgi:cytochrome c oxidase assembly factor CtaG